MGRKDMVAVVTVLMLRSGTQHNALVLILSSPRAFLNFWYAYCKSSVFSGELRPIRLATVLKR